MTFNKYSDSKIYKITSIDNSIPFCYYGSTTQSIEHRFYMHKASFKHWMKNQSKPMATTYPFFKEHGVDKFKIELVAGLNCKTHKELLTLERYHTDNNNCVNKNKPIISIEELKEMKRNTSREYYKNNRNKHIEDVLRRYHLNRQKLIIAGKILI